VEEEKVSRLSAALPLLPALHLPLSSAEINVQTALAASCLPRVQNHPLNRTVGHLIAYM